MLSSNRKTWIFAVSVCFMFLTVVPVLSQATPPAMMCAASLMNLPAFKKDFSTNPIRQFSIEEVSNRVLAVNFMVGVNKGDFRRYMLQNGSTLHATCPEAVLLHLADEVAASQSFYVTGETEYCRSKKDDCYVITDLLKLKSLSSLKPAPVTGSVSSANKAANPMAAVAPAQLSDNERCFLNGVLDSRVNNRADCLFAGGEVRSPREQQLRNSAPTAK